MKKKLLLHFLLFAVLGIVLDTTAASLLSGIQIGKTHKERLLRSSRLIDENLQHTIPPTVNAIRTFVSNPENMKVLIAASRSGQLGTLEQEFIFSQEVMRAYFSMADLAGIEDWAIYYRKDPNQAPGRIIAFHGAQEELLLGREKTLKYGISGYLDVTKKQRESNYPLILGGNRKAFEDKNGALRANLEFAMTHDDDRLMICHDCPDPNFFLLVSKPTGFKWKHWSDVMDIDIHILGPEGNQLLGEENIETVNLLNHWGNEIETLTDKHGNKHNALLMPITAGQKTIGYSLLTISRSFVHSAMWNTVLLLGCIGLVIICIVFLASRPFVNSFFRPIKELDDATKAMAAGDLHAPVNADAENELGSLGKSFLAMRDSIEEKITSLHYEIGEREKAEKELAIHLTELEEIVEKRTKELEKERYHQIQNDKLAALGVMAAGIAHEINNPLAIIKLRASHIKKSVEMGIPLEKVRELSDMIDSTCDRITRIVHSLKIFSRASSDHDPIRSVPIKTLIEDVLALCKMRFAQHGIHIELEGPSETILVGCRDIQVGQILINLLNNAFDALESSKGDAIKILIKPSKDRVIIEVQDNGPGIPDSAIAHIFEPFFTTKDVGKGTGMGLSISKNLAESNGGDLQVKTSPEGTTFYLSLPAAS